MKSKLPRLFVALAIFSTAHLAHAEAAGFAGPIQVAQNAANWRKAPALKANFKLKFGGEERFLGKILMTPSNSGIRLERADGATLIFDGNDVWLSPAKAEWPRARFDIFTWAYFWAAPYKLNDPGTYIEETGKAILRGKEYDTAKLTFANGTGDASDDWYVLYRDPKSNRLTAMAYIVTFGRNQTEAEKEPHAIFYETFEDFDGISTPTKWTFWNWSKENGLTGEMLGEATLANVTISNPAADAFQKPQDAVIAAMPK